MLGQRFRLKLFLSTPSARRATRGGREHRRRDHHFYPRPPRGGRLISIYHHLSSTTFLSTPSARRATISKLDRRKKNHISIHALREEGDGRGGREHRRRDHHFYPRPPRGGRQFWYSHAGSPPQFLSTPSARRATEVSSPKVAIKLNFYPRPPRGGRQGAVCHIAQRDGISIHALREEGDFCSCVILSHTTKDFYPRPPRGGRPKMLGSAQAAQEDFYPRPPRGGRQPSATTPRGAFKFLSTPSARRATAKTERKPSAFVSLYTSLHKLQRGACKTNRKITPLLVQTAGIPVRSVRENHVRCLFALAGHQKISTLSCANSGCSPTCSTLVW